jgi:glycosyltransferase involved in cell wall biosynthesis
MADKIAYIKVHSHPINKRIVTMLEKQFPGLTIDVIDVGLMLTRKTRIWINLFYVFMEYGWEILLGKKKVRECFWRTTYLFKQAKKLVHGVLSQNAYKFSFQNQSMFDGSISGLPHYVYTDHTHLANLRYPDFKKGDLYSARWIELEKSVYHNATFNFTRNDLAAQSIVRDYACPSEKVLCVYVGGNTGMDFEVNEGKYSNKNILFVGFEWERKGGPELVEAFRRVLVVHPDARLTIVGCSPDLDVTNCEVVGVVPTERLNDYYEQASVLCIPSKHEPYAIVFLEAFSHGLPVVATNTETMADFVSEGETGYLVGEGDVAYLAEILNYLLNDPAKCRLLGQNGRHLVLTKYNWDTVGAEIRKQINRTLPNKP